MGDKKGTHVRNKLGAFMRYKLGTHMRNKKGACRRFITHKPIYVIIHINKMKDKNCVILLVDGGKVCAQINALS